MFWLFACTVQTGLTPEPADPAAPAPRLSPFPAGVHRPEPWGDVPGWEDYPCVDELPDRIPRIQPIEELVYPELWALGYSVDCQSGGDCGHGDVPTNIGVLLWEVDGTGGFVPDGEHLWVYAMGRWDQPEGERAQGWYSLDCDYLDGHFDRRSVSLLGRTPRGPVDDYCTREAGLEPAQLSMCLSRVRPDQLTGLVFVATLGMDMVQYVAHFDFVFPHHPGVQMTEDNDLPEGRDEHAEWWFGGGWLYYPSLPYDKAWPWETITDPAVRDAYFEAYTPYGWPWPE